MSAPDSPEQTARLAAAQRAGEGELFIVLNAASGRGGEQDRVQAVTAMLEASGRAFRFIPCATEGLPAACEHGAQLAAAHAGVLVAVGGDGTINCAAQAALRHGCPLGVVAQGTFNLFAREHGLPQELEQGVRALLQASVEPVQVGLVNGRVFLANAAVGLYPKLLEDRENAKQQLGRRRRWVAVVSGLVSLLEWRWQLTLDAELDGHFTRLRTPSLFVCNNRTQLRRVGIGDEVISHVGLGRMAALVAHPLGTWGKLKLLLRAVFGRLGEARELDCVSLRSLDVSTRSARKLKVATDGEVLWMQLPLRFAVSPKPLLLLMPREQDRVAAQ